MSRHQVSYLFGAQLRSPHLCLACFVVNSLMWYQTSVLEADFEPITSWLHLPNAGLQVAFIHTPGFFDTCSVGLCTAHL